MGACFIILLFFRGGSQGHIRAAFATAEWRIPLYTRAGEPSRLSDLKSEEFTATAAQSQSGGERSQKHRISIHLNNETLSIHPP